MPERNKVYARIQSVRIKNLEDQVHMMHKELHRLREGMFHQHDVVKLSNLMGRLKELNILLIDLRNYYNRMQHSMFKQEFGGTPRSCRYTVQQKESECINTQGSQQHLEKRQNNVQVSEFLNVEQENNELLCADASKDCTRELAGFDERLSETTRESDLSEPKTETCFIRKGAQETFKTCKQLMDEIKPPSSILGKYLTRLQDFRTDPELRRQRWEKKQQEKLQQLRSRKYMRCLEDKTTLRQRKEQSTNSLDENIKLNNQEVQNGLELPTNLRVIKNDLSKIIKDIIKDIEMTAVALTVVLENDFVYHISISEISNGHSMACFLATEEAVQEARRQHLFKDLLTFFVVNAENSVDQKDRILGHLFEFIKTDDK